MIFYCSIMGIIILSLPCLLNISFKVKEYSIKVFVPLGFSVDENELEVIFPDVSYWYKKCN